MTPETDIETAIPLTPTYFGGHCLLCMRCMTGKSDDPDNVWEKKLDKIVLPQYVADRSDFVRILAKGPRVGHRCSKEHAEKYGRRRQVPDGVQVGDVLMLPTTDDVRRYRPRELGGRLMFIEESFPVAVVEDYEE